LVRLASCKLLELPAVSKDRLVAPRGDVDEDAVSAEPGTPRDAPPRVLSVRDRTAARDDEDEDEDEDDDEGEHKQVVFVGLTPTTRHCGLGR
jgi:hypothetical protein